MPMRLLKPAVMVEWHKTYGDRVDEIRKTLEDPKLLLAHMDR